MLDLEYWNVDLLSNLEVIQEIYKVVHTFCANVEDCTKCVKELCSFHLKGLFANPLVQEMAKEQIAWKWWWMMNGGEHHSFLQNIAMKVLSQCIANSNSQKKLEHV